MNLNDKTIEDLRATLSRYEASHAVIAVTPHQSANCQYGCRGGCDGSCWPTCSGSCKSGCSGKSF